MPTLTDLMVAELTRPDVAARVPAQARETWQAFHRLLLQIGGALMRVAQLPPSPGYEPYFVAKKGGRLGAHGLAHLLVHAGKRRARDSQWRGKVIKALRELATLRQQRALKPRVDTLLKAWDESSVIETIFHEAGQDEFEFVRLLEAARAGNTSVFNRLAEIAVTLAPKLTVARGPKRQADSEAHVLFLQTGGEFGYSRGYTWTDLEGNFTDPQTQATRLEFNKPTFNPIPARRVVKRRLSARPRDGQAQRASRSKRAN